MPYKDPKDPRRKANAKAANARYRAKHVDYEKVRQREYHRAHRDEINRRHHRNGLLRKSMEPRL